ncbi:TPA: SdrD B-like domain-containing protein [Staphylococcus aureus]|nr:LPXTG cell wall anchor domain-containing protein [Staphylococcus aureus]
MIKLNNIFRRFVIGGATFALTAFLATINGVPNAQASENESEESKIAKNTNLQKDTSKDEKQDGKSYQDNIQQLENNVGKIEHASKKEYKPLEPSSLKNGNDHSLKIKTHEYYTKWTSCVESEQPKTFEIGDFVWEDINKNGKQDKDEKGIAGVEIQLEDSNFKVIQTVKTDKNGRYLFNNVPKGLYFFEVKVPEGYEFTISRNSVDGNIDSDGPTAIANVVDENRYWYDFGLVKKESTPEPTPEPEKPENNQLLPPMPNPLIPIIPDKAVNSEKTETPTLNKPEGPEKTMKHKKKISSERQVKAITNEKVKKVEKKQPTTKVAVKELPKTGEKSKSTALFAGLLTLTSALLFFRRKEKIK